MIKKLKIKNYGFSLLEVVLYLAILSTLVFGIGLFVNLVSVARVRNQTMTEVDQQALQIIQNITMAIHNAKSVTAPTIGQNQDNLIIVDSGNNTNTFALNSGILSVDKGAGFINLNNGLIIVTDLLFKNLSRAGTPDIIQINFTVTYKNDSNNQNYNYIKNYVASAYLSK